MKPIIGITVEPHQDLEDARSGGILKLNWNYAQTIADAGAVPVLIPPVADPEVVAQIIHGWLIPGGLDIDAAQFGQENHPEVAMQDPSRYRIEQALYQALPAEMPILGICYGCQFLNVVRGGDLVQHLPDEVGHDAHNGGSWETNPVVVDSTLGALVGEQVQGRSYHHQAVGKLGQGLRVTSQSHDGVVEAIEAIDRPWTIGVQWHPERSYDDPGNRKLIEAFVEQARIFAEHRTGR